MVFCKHNYLPFLNKGSWLCDLKPSGIRPPGGFFIWLAIRRLLLRYAVLESLLIALLAGEESHRPKVF